VIVQTEFELPPGDRICRQFVVAAADHENVAYRLEGESHRLDIGVRPEIARTVPDDSTGHKDPGEWLVRYDDVRKRFVVLEENIVTGLELLDEIGFKDKGFDFRIRDNQLYVSYFRNERFELCVHAAGFLKILPDPAAKVLRFTDIDHLSIGVLELIHAGFRRERVELLSERKVILLNADFHTHSKRKGHRIHCF
jgi:hypothetical protein